MFEKFHVSFGLSSFNASDSLESSLSDAERDQHLGIGAVRLAPKKLHICITMRIKMKMKKSVASIWALEQFFLLRSTLKKVHICITMRIKKMKVKKTVANI